MRVDDEAGERHVDARGRRDRPHSVVGQEEPRQRQHQRLRAALGLGLGKSSLWSNVVELGKIMGAAGRTGNRRTVEVRGYPAQRGEADPGLVAVDDRTEAEAENGARLHRQIEPGEEAGAGLVLARLELVAQQRWDTWQREACQC